MVGSNGKMSQRQITIIAIVIILVLIVIYYNSRLYKIYSDQIEGMWMAPESFCQQSDIDGMLMYVGPKIKSSLMGPEKRKVCLIMHGNNTTIAYKKLEVNLGSPLMSIVLPFVGISSKWSRSAKITDDSDEVADPEIDIMSESDDASTIPLEKIMPNRVTITVDLNEGKMTWTGAPLENSSRRKESDEPTVYAELYKDNASSAIGKNLSEVHSNSMDLDVVIPEAS